MLEVAKQSKFTNDKFTVVFSSMIQLTLQNLLKMVAGVKMNHKIPGIKNTDDIAYDTTALAGVTLKNSKRDGNNTNEQNILLIHIIT